MKTCLLSPQKPLSSVATEDTSSVATEDMSPAVAEAKPSVTIKEN